MALVTTGRPESLSRTGPTVRDRYEAWVRAGLACLRAEYPHHGFLVIHHRWYAIRGRDTIIVSSGPEELRRSLAPLSYPMAMHDRPL